MLKHIIAAAIAMAAIASPANAGAGNEGWPTASFEIFKLAPGKQEEFIRQIARYDQILAAGEQPPLKIFLHEEGSDWDVIIYKQSGDFNPTPEQQAAMDAKSAEIGMETGPAYFIKLRKLVASHNDNRALGPISAGEWLERLDKWRAEHGRSGE